MIDKSLVSDSGTYSAHVGRRTTTQLRVDVICERPVFTHGLTDQPVITAEPVTFTAVVRGTPRPQICWFIGGVEVVHTAGRYHMSYQQDGQAQLTIVSAASCDIGLSCECRASSEAGEAISVAYLVPGRCQDKPVITARCTETVRIMGWLLTAVLCWLPFYWPAWVSSC